MDHTDPLMRAIRAAGIAVACTVHGILLLDSSPLEAVDLNSGAINASQFALSINYQSPTPPADDRSKAVTESPAVAEPPDVAEHKASKMPVEQKKVETTPALKVDNNLQAEMPPAVQLPQKNVVHKQEQPAEQIIDKPVVEPEKSAAPPNTVAAAPTPDHSQGLHEAVIAKPLFAAPPEPPIYPKLARKRGQQGIVWIEVLLGHTGQQIRAEIHQSSGVSLLDRAALTVVKKWQFIAHRINGVAVASRIRIPVEFSLD